MPKGKKKGKEPRREREREREAASSDDESLDNYSETSAQSEVRSNQDDTEAEDSVTRLQDKVCECVELLDAKAAATRAGALDSLRTGLSRRYLAHVLAPHRATLADHVSRALRKGKTQERRAAAAVAPLLAIQVGEECGEEFVREVRPALLALALDSAVDPDLRAECCAAVGVLCLVLEEDISAVLELLVAFETIFRGSYLKGDGSVKVSGLAVAEGALHAAALDAWTLLLPLVPSEHARSMLLAGATRPHVGHLVNLLEAYSLEVRMAAGTALAVVHERVCEDSPEAEEAVRAALPLLTDLARDSNKFRAKRDRKAQRATFRDILKYLEDEEFETESVRVGTESVILSTWAERVAYAALAGALGAGLQACVANHVPLRTALGLDEVPPQPLAPKDVRLNKMQRHLANAAAFKARTISRGKNRDKRSTVLAV